MAFESVCTERFGDCDRYAHNHCSDCGAVLHDDFAACSVCNESYMCRACKAKNPDCAWCRERAETPCADCGKPVGLDAVNIGLKQREDGTYIEIGPTVLLCGSCFIARGSCDPKTCEECRLGAA